MPLPPSRPAVAWPEGARPWSEAPAAALAGLSGVLTDIDDTLTREGGVEPAAAQAIDRLAEAGLPVIAVTGRPAGWSEAVVQALRVSAVVAENGGVMLRRAPGGSGLQRDFVQPDAERRHNQRRLADCAAAVLQAVPGATLARDSAGRLTDIAVDHSEFSHLGPAQIDAVLAVMRAHGLTATVSSIHVNGWIGSHSKWTAAEWAVPAVTGHPLEPARWLYVGDSTNDEPLFERLPWSVGVANIRRFWPQLRHRPAFVTMGERGQGFAEVAHAVLGARGAVPWA